MPLEKENKYVYLKNYTLRHRKEGIGNLDDFRRDIISNLGDNIFKYETIDDLIYNCLKIIYPINKNIKNEESIIQRKSLKVLQHFGYDKILKAEIFKIGDNGERIPFKKKPEPVLSSKEKFLNEIIRFKELPNMHLKYLKKDSECHLINITYLVNYYLNTSFISKNHWKEERPPSNQEERMLLDYYKRCLNEQQIILTYMYGKGIRERAISKATKMPFNIPFLNLNRIFDFPYFSSQSYSEGYFDHNLIDKVYHRLTDTTINEEDEMFKKLYFKNKRLFYSKLFKEYSPEQYFNDIKYYTQILPLSETRKNVLDELEFLFTKKKWISFFGIALSQIEGIFLEMSIIVGKKGEKSLYYKINDIKDSDSTNHLDYYQYYIPQLRNKFMHGALDGEEGNKVNSFDLLTDIRYLLKIFHELDNPLVQLKKILASHDYIFPTINEISSFFKLLDSDNQSLRKYIKNNIEIIRDFLYERLIENKNLDVILSNFNYEVSSDVETVVDFLNSIFKEKLELETSNPHQIRQFFEKEENLEKLKENVFILDNKLNDISCYHVFLSKHKKWLKNVEISTTNSLNIIEAEYINILKNLVAVKKINPA